MNFKLSNSYFCNVIKHKMILHGGAHSIMPCSIRRTLLPPAGQFAGQGVRTIPRACPSGSMTPGQPCWQSPVAPGWGLTSAPPPCSKAQEPLKWCPAGPWCPGTCSCPASRAAVLELGQPWCYFLKSFSSALLCWSWRVSLCHRLSLEVRP